MKILLFQIGREILGVELKSIVKVVSYSELDHGSEGKPSDNAQMINWQKNAVPVINLHKMIQEGGETKEKSIFIILSFNNRLRAVSVDSVEEICDVAFDRVIPIPKIILRKEDRIFSRAAALKDKIIPLIDHSMLFE